MKIKVGERSLGVILFLIGCILIQNIGANPVENTVAQSPQSAQELPLNVLNATAFWTSERSRVEATALNVQIWNETTFEDNEVKLNRSEVAYSVPNWVDAVNATFRINATLFYPAVMTGPLPGIVLIHGITDRRKGMYSTAILYAKSNFTVLCIDQVGHGDSEGPKWTPENMFYTGQFNKTSHQYLCFCSGMQAIRVLESLDLLVDDSKLAISGMSYGGWVSSIVGAIYHDKIDLILASVFSGAFDTWTRESFVSMISNMSIDDVFAWVDIHKYEVDPLYYNGILDYPDILWSIGTNDDFFAIDGLNWTYNSAKNGTGQRLLNIIPNEHHVNTLGNSCVYALRTKFYGQNAAPNITVLETNKNTAFMNGFSIKVKVTCDTRIKKVELVYYTNSIGTPWRTVVLVPESSSSNTYSGSILTIAPSSGLEYYVMVTLEGNDQTTFSSLVYSAGSMISTISIVFLVGIIGLIAFAIFNFIRQSYRREFQGENQTKPVSDKKMFILRNALIAGTEIGIFGSIWLTWTIYLPYMEWSLVFIFNHFFTYAGALGRLSYYITGIILTYLLFVAIFSFCQPLIAAILNSVYVFIVILFISMIGMLFGATTSFNIFGIGVYLMIILLIIQFIVGIKLRKRNKKAPTK